MQDVEVRRSLVADFIREVDEPVVADEVAHFFGVHRTTAHSDLKALTEEGVIFWRQETHAEREIRYNGGTRGTCAKLFWKTTPVPARQSREVVNGFVMTAAHVTRGDSRDVAAQKLAADFARRSPNRCFTRYAIAESAHVHPETVRLVLHELVELELVEKTGEFRNARPLYRMVDQGAIVRHLGGEAPLDDLEPEEQEEQESVEDIAAWLDGLREEVAELPELLEQRDALDEKITRLTAIRDALGG